MPLPRQGQVDQPTGVPLRLQGRAGGRAGPGERGARHADPGDHQRHGRHRAEEGHAREPAAPPARRPAGAGAQDEDGQHQQQGEPGVVGPAQPDQREPQQGQHPAGSGGACVRVERGRPACDRQHQPQGDRHRPVGGEPEVLEPLLVVGGDGEQHRHDDGCRAGQVLAAAQEVGGHRDQREAEEEVERAHRRSVTTEHGQGLDPQHVDDVELGEEGGVLAQREPEGRVAPEPPVDDDVVELGEHDGAVPDDRQRDAGPPLPHPQGQHADGGCQQRRQRSPEHVPVPGEGDGPGPHGCTQRRKSSSAAASCQVPACAIAGSSGSSRSARIAPTRCSVAYSAQPGRASANALYSRVVCAE